MDNKPNFRISFLVLVSVFLSCPLTFGYGDAVIDLHVSEKDRRGIFEQKATQIGDSGNYQHIPTEIKTKYGKPIPIDPKTYVNFCLGLDNMGISLFAGENKSPFFGINHELKKPWEELHSECVNSLLGKKPTKEVANELSECQVTEEAAKIQSGVCKAKLSDKSKKMVTSKSKTKMLPVYHLTQTKKFTQNLKLTEEELDTISNDLDYYSSCMTEPYRKAFQCAKDKFEGKSSSPEKASGRHVKKSHGTSH